MPTRYRVPSDKMSFLAGDSDMARRIREYDWASHPFGSPEAWPQSLRSAIGICLHSSFPTAIYWGPELRLLYNDAWAPIPGPRHPAALGAPAREVWSDIWHVIEPQFAHLYRTGEGIFVEDQMLPMRRFGFTEETYWSYSFTPIRGEDGAIAGVFNSGSETTRHVLSQRQMRFLLDLGEAFRTSTDPRVARRTAIEMLGRHIRADRVGFREIVPGVAGERAVTEEWTAPGVDSVGRNVRIADLGREIANHLQAGHILRIDDVHADPDLGEARHVLERLGVRALVAVPWMEHGRITAVIFLHAREQRAWNDFEVTTAEKVLERTVLWMEREHAAERERIMTREIDHRARNALAVAQSVVRLTAADDGDFRDKIESRIAALARAHALLSSQHWGPVELRSLLDQELAPYAEPGGERVQADGPPVPLRPEQAQTITLLLHELATNAAKYGALHAPGGRLRVSWCMAGERTLEIDWRESVPAARRPDEAGRSGFGSALLTRVVEQQFGGTISRNFDGGGLHCVIALPLAEARPVPERAEPAPAAAAADVNGHDRKSILIVEDEAMIAMDLEGVVSALGYDVFGTVATVTDGLKALEAGTPSLAIVDMNLSGDSSRPIAEALSARGVPMIFATGYADAGDVPETLVDAPRLSKPISQTELVRTITALSA